MFTRYKMFKYAVLHCEFRSEEADDEEEHKARTPATDPLVTEIKSWPQVENETLENVNYLVSLVCNPYCTVYIPPLSPRSYFPYHQVFFFISKGFFN
jgi:hypothetical protein